jgi:hypothetical protein
VKSLLDRYAGYLTPQGVILIRCYPGRGEREISKLIDSNYDVAEKRWQQSKTATVSIIAFRPKGSTNTNIGAGVGGEVMKPPM